MAAQGFSSDNAPPKTLNFKAVTDVKKTPQMFDRDVETKAEFAVRVGLSAPRISQLVKRGLPLSPEGRVRISAALRWMRDEVHAKGGRPLGSANGTGANGDPDLEAAKIRLTLAQADRAELELAARRGELVPAPEARRAVQLVAYTTREMMMNFPAKHGSEIAGELGIDPGTLIGLLDAHIRKALVKAAEQKMPDFMGESGDGR
ncbi:hypothetical protein O9X81_10630 [Agrobacterium salinitolerans]|uniref:hypothetical protein n=1 Tax=Agrobacterium salinitolerans TaxID=1183413 RepID=UPI0022B810E0|nr:hypothetical protein [Agrobacterium salinitolerans]MCZ7857073.1 hypothetical protein [Agrobacterium salinitolerans]